MTGVAGCFSKALMGKNTHHLLMIIVLAAQWLSLFHTSAAHIATAARLPDRGPGHYLEQLRSACETIQRNLTNPALTAETRAMLETVVRQLEVIASRWGQVEEL